MEDRLANLFGVTALAATDRLRTAIAGKGSRAASDAAALVHLQAYPDEPVEALRRVLGLSQPAAVRVVDRLADGGLLERRPGPDRRTLALRLTAAGQRAADELLARRSESLRGLLAGLTAEEREALVPLLERLVAGLAEDRPQAVRVCRLCDRRACASAPGCPLDHTTAAER